MKVFLTGGTGFIGSHLTESLLEKGFEIISLVRNEKNIRFPVSDKVKLVYGDIKNIDGLKEGLKDCEIILHLAALTTALKYEDYLQANAVSCNNLLKNVDEKKFKQFIFISSQAACGPSTEIPKNENDIENPISYYGKSKLEGEKIVKNSGKIYTILRPSSVYGERGHEFLPLFKLVRNGIKFVLGSGNKKVSMIYVKDLVDAILSVIDNKKAFNKTFNVCDGFIYSWNDIYNTAEKAVGRKCKRIRLPFFIPVTLGFINSLLEKIIRRPFLLNQQKLKEMKEDFQLIDNKKIKDELNFLPKFNLKEGFKNTFMWYVENNWIKRLN